MRTVEVLIKPLRPMRNVCWRRIIYEISLIATPT